jgi:hypothetical protein
LGRISPQVASLATFRRLLQRWNGWMGRDQVRN